MPLLRFPAITRIVTVVANAQEHLARLRLQPEGMSRELVRLRWLAIGAPLLFLTVVAFLVRGPFHHELHTFPGFVYVLVALAAGVSVFSFAIFALIGSVEAELIERSQRLEAVLAVGRAASSSLRLADLLDAALDAILAVTSAEAAELWLLEGGELVLERQRGLDQGAFCERTRFRLGEGLPGAAALSGRPVVVHDLDVNPEFLRPRVVELGFQSFGAFPLARRGEIVGVLGVAARNETAFTGDVDRRLLEGIGEQVAVAIENARLHARVLDGAVLDERERLARELHDSLAQVLGYVNAQTLAIKKLLASDRREEAEAAVAEMEGASRRVYLDVREAILGLRSSGDGLVESLRSYVSHFERFAGVEVRFEVDERVAAPAVAASTEIQLVRIVQEALTNVRKHARAQCARVTIGVEHGELLVSVADDGRGFTLGSRPRTGWPHFGVQSMHERAEAIGGRLELASTPGGGTSVLVRVPLAHPLEVNDARRAG